MNKRTRMRLFSASVIAFFLVLAAVGFLLSKSVKVNYDLADYLDSDTETRVALDKLTEDFGMTGNVQIMVEGADKDDADTLFSSLSALDGVLYLSRTQKENGKVLFTILVDGDDNSDTAKSVVAGAKALFSETAFTVEYGGSAVKTAAIQANTQNEMSLIIVIVILLSVFLLLLSASSWLEPLLLLSVSGVAILINMGLNFFLGEISFITNSIAAILQLALSIDYSIVLLHTFRDIRKEETDPAAAMKKAVKSVFLPVLASALTTVAGLAALLFMTFTIGIDLGLVLIKGIILAAIASLTLLPAAVLLLDKPLEKTVKRPLIPKGEIFCKVTKKASHIILPVAAVTIVIAAVLQVFNTYTFTDATGENKKIIEEFGRESTVVLLYEKNEDRESDYEKERLLLSALAEYKKADGSPVLLSAVSLSATAEAEYTPEGLSATLGVPEEDARLLFTMQRLYDDPSLLSLSPAELLSAADLALSVFDEGEAKAALSEGLSLLRGVSAFTASEHTPEEFRLSLASLSGGEVFSEKNAAYIYELYARRNGESEIPERLYGRDIVAFLLKEADTNLVIKQVIKANEKQKLRDMLRIDAFLSDTGAYDFRKMGEKLSLFIPTLESISLDGLESLDGTASLVSGIYILRAAAESDFPLPPVKAHTLVSFLSAEAEQNPILRMKLDEEMRGKVSEVASEIDTAYSLLVGERYARVLLSFDLPNESGEPTAVIGKLIEDGRSVFGENLFFAGELISTYDLEAAFTVDNLIITLFTVTAVFLIIMAVFRSLSLPIILVTVIQGAIFLALATSLLLGSGIFFLSYIVTTCILMGATIDYGILMSSSYVNLRISLSREDALNGAVRIAMPTVFTSGITLVVCGAAIAVISSQPSIGSVGLLIAKGALGSILLITLVLPSILYRLDGFVLRLTWKKRSRNEQ